MLCVHNLLPAAAGRRTLSLSRDAAAHRGRTRLLERVGCEVDVVGDLQLD